MLAELGHAQPALDLIEQHTTPAVTDHGLACGLSGIGLNLLHLGLTHHEDDLRDHAIAVAEQLADMLPAAAEAPPGGKARPGLARGWSGPAMLFTRLYGHTGDHSRLDLAEHSIARDLDECAITADGSTQVYDGNRTLPYLATGSAAIALGLTELACHRPEAVHVAPLPDLVCACLPQRIRHPDRPRLGTRQTRTRRRTRRPS